MHLDEVSRLHRHWQQFPPLRVIVAAVAASLGVKVVAEQPNTAYHMNADEARRLLEATGGRIPGVAQG